MVFGTSVGSINAAMIAQGETDFIEKLWLELETDMVFDIPDLQKDELLSYTKGFLSEGGMGASGLKELLKSYIDEEKIRSGAITYGLVATEFPSLDGVFMYLDDIPEGRLTDYILASASCFPAVQKCVIGDRTFIDGGYRDNLPVEMALNKDADKIIAVDLQAVGVIRDDTLKEAQEKCDEFHIIKSHFELGNFLVFDKNNSQRIVQLGYLDTMRHWNKYDGKRYTFEKDAFTKHQLAGADSAAYFLQMDPCIIYTRDGFLSSCTEQIKRSLDDASLKEHILFVIAKSLKEDEHESIFMQPAIFKILREEIQAANFLIQNNLF